jgi:hypothetical protein
MPHSAMVRGLEKVVYFYETPVTHPGWEPIMYFDLASDPGEFHNRYPENAERAQDLYNDLSSYLQRVGARIPQVPNPDYDPAVYESAKEYEYRMSRGPFVGTREPEEDEWITTYADYWMDSWGVELGEKKTTLTATE